MGEHKLPRIPPEDFLIHEPATGKSIAIREASDAHLARAREDASKQHHSLAVQVMQILQLATEAAKAEAVLAYEIDRRKRTITIATSLDITGLRP